MNEEEEYRKHAEAEYRKDRCKYDPSCDYYTVLGVSFSATHDEIKRAYRASAPTYHPDGKRNTSDDKIKNLNAAKEVLRNPEWRKDYDQNRQEYEHKKAKLDREAIYARIRDLFESGDIEGAVAEAASLYARFRNDADCQDLYADVLRKWAASLEEKGKLKEAAVQLRKAAEHALDEELRARIRADLEVLRARGEAATASRPSPTRRSAATPPTGIPASDPIYRTVAPVGARPVRMSPPAPSGWTVRRVLRVALLTLVGLFLLNLTGGLLTLIWRVSNSQPASSSPVSSQPTGLYMTPAPAPTFSNEPHPDLSSEGFTEGLEAIKPDRLKNPPKYIARLSLRDHFSRDGRDLRKVPGIQVRDILLQDRLNYYEFNQRDKEDEPDTVYEENPSMPTYRDIFKYRKLQVIPAGHEAELIYGNRLVEVTMAPFEITVRIIGQEPGIVANSKQFTPHTDTLPTPFQPDCKYRARLSQRDHFTHDGRDLRRVPNVRPNDILLQDRLNFHRYTNRDVGDESDALFDKMSTEAYRSLFESQPWRISPPGASQTILEGTPLVEVSIGPNQNVVRIIDSARPAPRVTARPRQRPIFIPGTNLQVPQIPMPP